MMVMLPLTIRKRTITEQDLKRIQATINEHWDKGRKQISKILCQKWNWVQPNGRLKDMACRELLLVLNRKDLLTLPPRLKRANNEKRNRSIDLVEIDQSPLHGNLSDLSTVKLILVRNTAFEPLYNSLIQQHHYLGYRQIVGSHLKYMAFIGDRPVACIGWGSASWAVKARESFIGWSNSEKKANLHFIANNTRFLLLPSVSVKSLASKILALNARRISDDWLNIYNHHLYLLETFVEKDRFKGTCYKAANWIRTGQTQGIAKKGHDHLFHGRIKDVYLYPLRKDFRKKLIG